MKKIALVLLILLVKPTFGWLPFHDGLSDIVSRKVIEPVVGSLLTVGCLVSAFYWWRSYRTIKVLRTHIDASNKKTQAMIKELHEDVKLVREHQVRLDS